MKATIPELIIGTIASLLFVSALLVIVHFVVKFW